MRLQANIPDTLPGQSVSFLVFGDVQLENKVTPTLSPSVTVASNTVLLVNLLSCAINRNDQPIQTTFHRFFCIGIS